MTVKFFLGANSGKGFFSLYDEFRHGENDVLHLIKGGPGGGKSGFMRKIGKAAEEAGFDVEYILCSGDPDSLDGVYIPALHTGYADATAPHIIEPKCFGLDSCYVNLGQFCEPVQSNAIAEYTKDYKTMYSRAYSMLAAAKEVKSSEIPLFLTNSDIIAAKKRAKSALNRELGRSKGGVGKASKRFIRCISCKGELALNSTVSELCKHIYKLDDRLGLAKYYLSEIAESCALRGENTTLCPSPLDPEVLDAVLLPDRALGFVSASVMELEAPWRHVRLDSLVDAEKVRAHRGEIRRSERLYEALLNEACLYLKEAKQYHDLLEKAYNPHVDFEALNRFTQKEIETLF